MMIYLATAIDRANGNPKDRANELVKLFEQAGYRGGIYCPQLAFSIVDTVTFTKRDIDALININYLALTSSDVMVMDYEPGVESWGMPQEAFLSYMHNTPLFILSPTRFQELPLYLRGRTLASRVYPKIKPLMSAVWAQSKRGFK